MALHSVSKRQVERTNPVPNSNDLILSDSDMNQAIGRMAHGTVSTNYVGPGVLPTNPFLNGILGPHVQLSTTITVPSSYASGIYSNTVTLPVSGLPLFVSSVTPPFTIESDESIFSVPFSFFDTTTGLLSYSMFATVSTGAISYNLQIMAGDSLAVGDWVVTC